MKCWIYGHQKGFPARIPIQHPVFLVMYSQRITVMPPPGFCIVLKP